MSRRFFSATLSLFVFVVFAPALIAKSGTPKENTRAAVKAYVERAADLVAHKGPVCDTLKDKSWMSGDWYVFVDGSDGRLLCHPDPKMVGRSNSDIVDANGKHVGDMINAAANSPAGNGWVEYVWPRPGQTKPVPKSTYVKTVTGPDGKKYIVGAGGYELK